jgi:hypothetical protein
MKVARQHFAQMQQMMRRADAPNSATGLAEIMSFGPSVVDLKFLRSCTHSYRNCKSKTTLEL